MRTRLREDRHPGPEANTQLAPHRRSRTSSTQPSRQAPHLRETAAECAARQRRRVRRSARMGPSNPLRARHNAPTMRLLDLLRLHGHLREQPNDSPRSCRGCGATRLTAQRGRSRPVLSAPGQRHVNEWGMAVLANRADRRGARRRSARRTAGAGGCVWEYGRANPAPRPGCSAMARTTRTLVSFVLAISLLHKVL